MSRKLTFIVLTLVLFLAACAGAGTETAVIPSDSSITLMDGLNRTVTLPAPAQRVVSLTPSNTEILFAVGAGEQVVGRDMFSDYPPEAASVQDIGGSMGEYDLEAILALQPDLVLASGLNPPELVASLEDLGLTVYYLPNPDSIQGMFSNLKIVADLTGHEAEADALVESLSARLDAVDAAVFPLDDHPTVYYELDATNPALPYTASPSTYVSHLILRAGGFNIAPASREDWITISVEELLVADPDIILLGDAAYGETPEKVAARPGWDALTAVQTGQIFPFDDNLVSRPGPRMVDGLEALVEIFYPGLLK